MPENEIQSPLDARARHVRGLTSDRRIAMLDDRHGSQSPAHLPHPIAVLLVALLAAIFSPSAWAQPWAKSPRGAAPTFPHASQTLAAVQQQIARLKAAGDEEAARQIAQAIEIIKSQMTGDYAPTSSDEPEVHGVSLQEGAPPPPGLITGKHRFTTGYAEVQITHTARPILLVLQGSRAIHWNVKPAKGVKFAAVLLSGGEQQTVAGLPPKTLIVDHSAGRATGEGVPSISDSAEARSVLDSWALDQLGFPIATALSASQYTGAPIVIASKNSDSKASTTSHSRAPALATRDRHRAAWENSPSPARSNRPCGRSKPMSDSPSPLKSAGKRTDSRSPSTANW
jgi:hypothetical protein